MKSVARNIRYYLLETNTLTSSQIYCANLVVVYYSAIYSAIVQLMANLKFIVQFIVQLIVQFIVHKYL